MKSVALPSGHNLILTDLLVDATSWSSWWYVFVPSNSVETSSTPLIALTTPESHPSAESASFASGNLFKKKTQRVQAVVIFKSSTKLTEKKLGITLGPPHLWPVLCSLKKSSSLLRGQWHQKVNTFFETSFYLSFEDSKKKASEFLKKHKRMAGDAFSYMEKNHAYLVRSQQT